MNNRSRSLKHFAAVSAVLILSLAWLAGGSVLAADTQEYITSAQKLLGKGQVQAAVIELKNAVQQDPENRTARLLLGTTYLKLGDFPSAEKELSRARVLGAARADWIVPLGKATVNQGRAAEAIDLLRVEAEDATETKVQIHALRSQASLMLKQIDQAKAELDAAGKLVPKHAEIQLGLARIALVENDIKRSAQHVENAVALAPANAETWVMRAELYRHDGKVDKALGAFTKAVEVDPYHRNARLGKAAMHISLGDIKAAEAELETVKKESPNLIMVQYLSGVVAFYKKEYDAAKNTLQLVVRAVPGHLPSQLLLGIIGYTQGQYETAETYLSRYVAAVPGNAVAVKALAAVRLKRKDAKGAIEVLRPLVNKAQDDAQLLSLLGGAYMQNREYEQGMEYLEKAAALAPDAASLHTQMALGKLALGEKEEAVAQLESAVDVGDASQADLLLIMVHLRSKEYDKALSAAQALAKKLPDSPLPLNLASAAYLGKGDRTAARKQLEGALKIDPKFTTAHINLARMDEQDNNLDKARQRYQQVLKDNPKHIGAMLGMARVAEQGASIDDAVRWVEKAREADPKSLEPALLLANYYQAKKEPLKALSIVRELADAVPNNPLVLEALGSAQLAADEKASAVTTFQRLIELNPKQPNSHLLLARAHMSQKSNDKARSAIMRALEVEKDYVPALLALASMELVEGKDAKAREIALNLQTLHPKSAIGHQLEGDVHTHGGAHAQAAKTYAQAYRLEPTGQRALLTYGAYKRAGDANNAVAALTDWLGKQSGDTTVRVALASDYHQRGKTADAIREYETARKQEPSNATVLNNLGWLYFQQGDAKGLEYAKKAYELAPQRPEIADTYGWILLQKTDPKKALTILQDAAVKAPHMGSIRYHLAVALDKNGRKEDARKELQRLLDSNKDFPEAGEAKKLLEQLKAK